MQQLTVVEPPSVVAVQPSLVIPAMVKRESKNGFPIEAFGNDRLSTYLA